MSNIPKTNQTVSIQIANENDSNAKINKFKKSEKKIKFTTHYGRNEMVEADLYYRLLEENARLKQQVNDLQDQLKKMDVAMKYHKVSASTLVDSSDLETLKIENQNLKSKNSKMKTIISGLQSELRRKGKSSMGSKQFVPSQYEKNEYLEHIAYLQEALKNKYEENQSLLNQLRDRDDVKTSLRITEYCNDLSDKNAKLADLSAKYDKVMNQFETNVKILTLTKEALQEYIEKYTDERNKNRNLENQLQMNQSSLDKLNEYAAMIEDYKKKEKLLEERISDLCENPFIKQANERDKAFVKVKEYEIAIEELTRKLKATEDKNKIQDEKIKELADKLTLAGMERDQFKEDALRYKISTEEKEKQNKEFDEQFKRISQFGEVDSNYEKLLGLMRGNTQLNTDEKDPSKPKGTIKINQGGSKWMNIDFLEKADNIPDDKELLKKEVQRLIIEKGILGTELEKTKSLLEIQQQINDDLKKLKEMDDKKFQKEIKILQDKIKELLSLLDKERIPKEYLMDKNEMNNLVQNLIPKANLTQTSLLLTQKSLDDKITEFSNDQSESEYGINENAVDLIISQATFDSTAIENKLGISLNDLLSFISIDFYLHETQTSNLINGPNPNYNFQLTFRVYEDEHLINYLNEDYMIIELYYLSNNKQIIFGNGKIKLDQLIRAESNVKSRVVHGYCEMFFVGDNAVKLGRIKYKLRMRNSLRNILKWMNDKKGIIGEMSAVNTANLKMSQNS